MLILIRQTLTQNSNRIQTQMMLLSQSPTHSLSYGIHVLRPPSSPPHLHHLFHLLPPHLHEEVSQLRIEIAKLRQENAGLKLESASIKAQRDAAQAHAVFAGQQVAVYKHRYNSKVNKKESSKRVTTSARVLTSREVRKEIEQDAAKKVQRQKDEAERETRKAEAEKADIIRHAEQERLGTQFSGSLNSMTKKAMVDIAISLKVPSSDVTQDALCVRLKAHFDAHKELKKHPRYIGIFKQTRKRKDPPGGSNPGPSSFAPGPSSFAPGPSSFAPGPSSFAPGPSLYPLSMHHPSFAPPPFFELQSMSI
ncbi:hypothetical protein F5050DRAFT_1838230 [Lentinula boryana]|uniref:Uncharacterized protein n=1 Tax=Lentinula boryana TaxID=40481 RepID=A0ABQ8Q745_9AGAR|nr:hypothetical protein F5050DRAFT_1838230 [Lentinula boryana]